MVRPTIESINQQLKGTGVRLEQRGGKLALRATLPARTGWGNRQERISLGLPATVEGFEVAKGKAFELASQIIQKTFDWSKWDSRQIACDEILTCGQWVANFRRHRINTGYREIAWESNDRKLFARLPAEEELTEKILVKTLLQWEPNSRSRQLVASKFQQFAEFAGIKIDLKQYRGNYDPRKGKGRTIPTDLEIVEFFYGGFPSNHKAQRWRVAFGLMATYGLRDHEALLCRVGQVEPYACHVLRGKTGPRIALPLYPEWVQEFGLINGRLPDIDTDLDNIKIGKKVSDALGQYLKVKPWSPYDLRHAYAIRASVGFGYPVKVAADWLGHSPEEHLKTYSHWLKPAQALATYQAGLSRDDRPTPPSVPQS